MLKDILLFQSDEVNHNSLICWTKQIAEQLRRRNVRVHIVSLVGEPEEVVQSFVDLLSSVHTDGRHCMEQVMAVEE